METVFAKIGFWVKAGVAATVAALAMSCGDQMDVRTFELERLDASEAMALVAPYVFEEREGNPGEMSHTPGLLTVRELPENLDRIEAVLRRYDREAAGVRLGFKLIEADGFSERDEAIAEVEEELRGLLRYEGYRLIGEAVVEGREGQFSLQRMSSMLASDPVPFELAVSVGKVSRSENGDSVTLEVSLRAPQGELLMTTVTVQDEKTLVLGTTAMENYERMDFHALILVVTPVID